MTQRNQQRRQIRRRLKYLISSSYLQWASEQMCQFIINSPTFQHADSIACYWPMRYEADARPLIQACHRMQKSCYLPIIAPDNASYMAFRQYDAHATLYPNNLNIYEPPQNAATIDPMQLDLVITPLLGYDAKGYRLGQGGGYYDRTFTNKHQDQPPYLWGLALALQQVPDTSPEHWDIKLDNVVTEQGFCHS